MHIDIVDIVCHDCSHLEIFGLNNNIYVPQLDDRDTDNVIDDDDSKKHRLGLRVVFTLRSGGTGITPDRFMRLLSGKSKIVGTYLCKRESNLKK